MANKKILSGNEAIAAGAYVGGVSVASAYPGTPSTEILENLVKYPDVYCEWAVNEKVGMEVAIGASFAGKRSMTTMKHVGLNVAMDPLMTFAYVGANGGFVVVSADDPGMHSSQNEQDNRYIAKFAKIPMLEPSDSQDAYDMMIEAFKLSEKFSIPVMLRTTTRVSHSSGIVELGGFKRDAENGKKYEKNIAYTVPVPLYSRPMHVRIEQKLIDLEAYSETSKFNRLEKGTDGVGIITSGIAYAYVREAFPNASILHLGMTNPLPKKMIADFAASVDRLYIAEEDEPFIEEQVRAMGIKVCDPETSLRIGELNPDRINLMAAEVYGTEKPAKAEPITGLPGRPPVLCPGCSHRGVFYALSRLKCMVTGDIGCYSLGAFPPLSAMDTIICMGASVGNAHGLAKAGYEGKVAAVLGDSTFFHSGITGLLNIVYNKGCSTVIVLDNRITAMTGHQDNPGTGKTLMGEETIATRVEAIAAGLGVHRVRTVDPYNLDETYNIIKEELESDEPSVVVSCRPCVLGARLKVVRKFAVESDKCKKCKMCLKIGCPAIEVADDGTTRINPVLCVGCGMCEQVCKFGAIKETGI